MLARTPFRARCFLALAATGVAVVHTRGAEAVPLVAGLGGGAGYGTNRLANGDDGSSTAIDITPAFPSGIAIGGTTYTRVYVNVNGNLTLVGPNPTYTPDGFGTQAMFAPWWADVDTGGGSPTDSGHDAIYWDVRAGQVTVTWHNVGYFSEEDDHQNDFQVVLYLPEGCGAGCTDANVELRYAQCQWTTGDASGGTDGLGGDAAQAGLSSADGSFVTLPGSGTADVLNLCTTSNVGTDGLWAFTFRSGVITSCDGGGSPGCMGSDVAPDAGPPEMEADDFPDVADVSLPFDASTPDDGIGDIGAEPPAIDGGTTDVQIADASAPDAPPDARVSSSGGGCGCSQAVASTTIRVGPGISLLAMCFARPRRRRNRR